MGGNGNAGWDHFRVERVLGLRHRVPSDGMDETGVLANRFHSLYRKSGHRYISDVLVPPTASTVAEVVEELVQLLGVTRDTSASGLRLVSVHDQHVHTYPYTNGSCRCPWLQIQSDGGDSDDLDFDDEITSLTSRLSTGKGCLDISLATCIHADFRDEDGRHRLRFENLQVRDSQICNCFRCTYRFVDLLQTGGHQEITERPVVYGNEREADGDDLCQFGDGAHIESVQTVATGRPKSGRQI